MDGLEAEGARPNPPRSGFVTRIGLVGVTGRLRGLVGLAGRGFSASYPGGGTKVALRGLGVRLPSLTGLPWSNAACKSD